MKLIYRDSPEPDEDKANTEGQTARRRPRRRPPPPDDDDMNEVSRKHLRVTINNAWEKLDQYYGLTDNSPAYVASRNRGPSRNT